MTRTVSIANVSGFYGDRLSAMREVLEGGELDVLTGDYLAELTMLILGRDRMKNPDRGYAKTFLRQLEDCLGMATDHGVRIVANAGGLNPAGLADAVRALADKLGVELVEGSEKDPAIFDELVKARAENSDVDWVLVNPVISAGPNKARVKVRIETAGNPPTNAESTIVYDDGRWKLSNETVCNLLGLYQVESAMCAPAS